MDEALTEEPLIEEALIEALAKLWPRGWQPRDLMWVIGNDLGSGPAAALADAILAEAGGYDPQLLDPRWQAQLEQLARSQPHGVRSARHDSLLAACLQRFPALPLLIPAPGASLRPPLGGLASGGGLDERVLTRVRALLAKAESTTFPDEAEALSAKAHELMARHAIDQVLLAAGDQEGEPEGRRIHIENPYLNPKVMLLSEVGSANRCRTVWDRRFKFATLFGFRSDLEATDVLFTSLLVQATSAMLAAPPERDGRIKSFRNSFLIAYAHRIGERLSEIGAAAVADADDGSLLPVLKSRRESVDAATDAAFPNLGALNVSLSNAGGLLAGRAAADRADLHRQRVAGVSGSLDRT